MIGGFLKNGSCLRRFPLRRSISDFTTTTGSSSIVSSVIRNDSHCWAFSPHKRAFKKIKDFEFCPPVLSSRFSTSCSPLSFSKVGLVSWYLGMVKVRPVLTKSVTASLVYAAADLSAQAIARPSSEPFDLLRTMRMAGYGMLILGPSLHVWFNFVSSVFPKRDVMSTLKKIVMAQTLYGPAMTATFFSLNAGLKGETGSEIIARLKRDLVPTMINGVIYWPFCDFLTFRFIPVHLQPLVSNSFSYLWTVYMTYMASLEKPQLN